MNRHLPTTRWMILVALSLLTTGIAPVSAELSRGHKWVRHHPYTIMALSINPKLFIAEQYMAAGMTAALPWKIKTAMYEHIAEAGMPWHGHIRSSRLRKAGFTEEVKEQAISLVDKYPNCIAWLIWDEPQRIVMPQVGQAIEWFKEKYPDKLIYSNALPQGARRMTKYYGGPLPEEGYTYEQYMRDFATITKGDVLMYDAYPFMQDGSTKNMFGTMLLTRKIGLETNIPYWSFVQAYKDLRRKYRMPSESDVRMQVFMHLVCGYTGILYFTYENAQGPAMVENSTGKLRPIYYDVARLNKEVFNLGRSIRFLRSTDVRYLPGVDGQIPEPAIAWSADAGGEKRIRSITIEDSQEAADKDVLVGYFQDDSDRQYLMISNLWHDMNASADQRMLTVRLKVDPTITVVGRLSRETGQPEYLKVTNGELRITLPGGTGDLLQLGGASFPGLDE